MRVYQSYPILTYLMILTILTFISFIITLQTRKKRKAVIILPNRLKRKLIPSLSNGFLHSVEVYENVNMVPSKIYDSCIFVLDDKKSLEKQIDDLKKIRERVRNSVPVLIPRELGNLVILKEKLSDIEVYRYSRVEEIMDVIKRRI